VKSLCFLCLFCAYLAYPSGSVQGSTLLVSSAPSWLQLNPVSGKMVVNGLSSEVMHLVTSRSTEDVFGYFRKQWACGNGEKNCRQIASTPWSVLSRIDGANLDYVQVRRAGLETVGYVVRSNLKGKTLPVSRLVSHLQGSKVENDLVSQEGGRSARTMLVTNNYSLQTNRNHYDNSLTAGGWRKISDNSNLKGDVVIYRKGSQEASLVLTEQHGRTSVVISTTANR